MNHDQRKSDRQRRKARRSLAVGRAHDDEEKHHRHHDFRDEARDQGVLAGRMLAISIRRKTLGDIESGGAARDHIE